MCLHGPAQVPAAYPHKVPIHPPLMNGYANKKRGSVTTRYG
jgi:hypothetical protein